MSHMNTQHKLDPVYIQKVKNSSSLSDVAYDAIRKAITSGSYQPGDQLKQLDLAAELDVSQRTIREALTRLVSDGLVIQKPYKGFMVISISQEEQKEIYKLRAALEGLAMQDAANCISDADLKHMLDLLPFTAPGETEESIPLAREINREFHMIPVLATHQNLLIKILDQIWDLVLTYYSKTDENPSGIYQSRNDDVADHRQILEALEAHDGQRAQEAMTRHIENNLETLIKRLEEP
jgi:GntR family transcriptional regulator, rspAB operon transcriptional repressor